MMIEDSPPKSIFTLTSAYSLAGVVVLGLTAHLAARALLPAKARWQDRATFVWLVFDALIHFIFEGSFLWLSILGRTVNSSEGVFAEMARICRG
ncbi:hypothetical protein FA95DRAFT_94417 [Auriscalpium vulgare]|uniref:Uncharacterized protein n=1 Tax=Auriscalpium vulgare TaxID=40419 RepID=A0ACB8RPF2_9AGAM|nr:hypothetical protein FA95DRAFT_94417 [Auriscalpium vulgare]